MILKGENRLEGIKNYKFEGKSKLIFFALSLAALLATQTSEMPIISKLACSIPLVLMLINFKDYGIFWISAIIFLFTSIDQSITSNLETPQILRYTGYILIGFRLYYNAAFSRVYLIVLCVILSVGFLSAIFFSSHIFIDQFVTDIKVIVLLFMPAMAVKVPKINIALGELTFIMLFAVIGEIINIKLLQSPLEYTSYNSTKSLILIPIIWAILNKKYYISIILTLAILPVVFAYSTRMILVILLVFMLYHLVKLISQNLINALLIISTVYFLVSCTEISNKVSEVEFIGQNSKPAQMILTVVESLNATDLYFKNFFTMIDKGRAEENELFFGRPLINIILGTGLGSGIHDDKGIITAGIFDTAFSGPEINNRIFFNFHDFWIDVGTRFGLFGIGFYLFLILRKKNNLDPSPVTLALIYTPLLFFSTQGLLILAIFIMWARNSD